MKKRKILPGALALAMAVSAVMPAMAGVMSISHTTSYASSASVADHETDIVLHKMQYDLAEGEEKPVIENKRGKELSADELPEGVKPFDISEYGDVTFTLYKLTDASGKSPQIADFTGATISSDGTSVTVDGETFTLTKVEDQNIDVNGEARFSKKENGSYVIRETSSNENLVAEREQDLFFSLPLANALGTGFEPEVHLYPKNDVEDINFEFTKYLNSIGAENALEGVTFQLYKGTPGVDGEPYTFVDGDGVTQNKIFTTDNSGKFNFGKLPIGKYYLVETEVPADATTYKISPYAQNDQYNRLRFEIGNMKASDYKAEFINYEEPDADKKVNDGRHDDKTERDENGKHVDTSNHDFDIGDAIPFEVGVDIKENIMGGGVYKVGGVDQKQKPYGIYRIKDKPADNKLKIPEGEVGDSLSKRLGLEVKIGSTVLVEGTDYKVSADDSGTGFVVDFIMRNVDFTDLDGVTSSVPAVSETVANNIGSKITIGYNYELTEKAKPDEYIRNDMKFEYNNHPSGDEEYTVVIPDEDNVITYGKKFLKVSTKNKGLMEDPDAFLGGAEFVIFREVDGGREYLVVDENGKRDFKLVNPEADGSFTIPNNAYKLISSETDGTFEIFGLEKGDYFLKEIKAPDDHKINDKDIKFKVGPGTYAGKDATVDHIVNKKNTDFSDTGMMVGIALAGGVVILTGAGIYGMVKNKKNEDSELSY